MQALTPINGLPPRQQLMVPFCSRAISTLESLWRRTIAWCGLSSKPGSDPIQLVSQGLIYHRIVSESRIDLSLNARTGRAMPLQNLSARRARDTWRQCLLCCRFGSNQGPRVCVCFQALRCIERRNGKRSRCKSTSSAQNTAKIKGKRFRHGSKDLARKFLRHWMLKSTKGWIS